MNDVDKINLELTNFGTLLNGKSKYRLVWSDDEFEYRKGAFNEYYGEIFLRSFTGTKKVPKYNYIRGRWVLEFWVPPVMTGELVSLNGYEPLYIFEDAQGNYLPPNLTVCRILIHYHLNPTMNSLQRKELFESIDKKELEKEVEYFKTIMENENPYIAGMLKAGEAIVVPGKKEGTCKEN